MTELRKRLDSSMTYEEYVKTYDKAPNKPCLRPKQSPQIIDEDLDLTADVVQFQQDVPMPP